MQVTTPGKQAPYEYSYVYPSREKPNERYLFSRKEITHLAVATLLVVGAGLSFPYMAYDDYTMLVLLSVMFGASFLVHELAHKMMAQKNGMWAEFRLTMMGVVLTLLSILPTFIKIIGPGAVMVSSSADTKAIGKTSVVGPIANMTIASVFCMATFLPSSNWTFSTVAFYNAWIAIFNLIPFGMLDGYKVFVWDKRIWVLAFIASLTLGAISGSVVYRLL